MRPRDAKDLVCTFEKMGRLDAGQARMVEIAVDSANKMAQFGLKVYDFDKRLGKGDKEELRDLISSLETFVDYGQNYINKYGNPRNLQSNVSTASQTIKDLYKALQS